MSLNNWISQAFAQIQGTRGRDLGGAVEAEIRFKPLVYTSSNSSLDEKPASWRANLNFFHRIIQRHGGEVVHRRFTQMLWDRHPVKFQDKKRLMSARRRMFDTGEVEEICKFPVKDDGLVLREYNFKFDVSVEMPSQAYFNTFIKTYPAYQKTNVVRMSLIHPHHGHSLDLTEYTSQGPGPNKSTTYKIELELNLDSIVVSGDLAAALRWGFSLITGGSMIYGSTIWVPIIKKVVDSLRVSNVNYLSNGRNVLLRDLAGGGLISGKNSYYVSHKADGERVLVGSTTANDNLYQFLIHPPFTLALLKVEKTVMGGSFALLEGEMLSETDMEDDLDVGAVRDKTSVTRPAVLIYDTLIYEDQNMAIGADYATRLNRVDSWLTTVPGAVITSAGQTASLHLYKKQAWPIPLARESSPTTDFFALMRELDENPPRYPTDGLIFTPNRNYGKSNPKPTEDITKASIVLKWKPLDRLTIDFLINAQGLPGDSKGKIFVGDQRNPYQPQPLPNEYRGLIVEMGLNQEGDLVVIKPRPDKLFPNSPDVIRSNWIMMNRHLNMATLRGEGTVVMRWFHNRIKEALFNQAPERSTLIDLGSGRGGDLAKWRKFSRILAIEPNQENVRELIQRHHEEVLVIRDLNDVVEARSLLTDVRLVLLVCGAEDHQLISETAQAMLQGRRFDYMSTMLSLSLFQPKHLLALVPLARHLFYFTIDSASIKIAWERNQLPNTNSATIAVIQDDPLRIVVDIADSLLVHQQEESPPDTIALDRQLALSGMRLIKKTRADYVDFLNHTEIALSNLYVYGEFEQEK